MDGVLAGIGNMCFQKTDFACVIKNFRRDDGLMKPLANFDWFFAMPIAPIIRCAVIRGFSSICEAFEHVADQIACEWSGNRPAD